MKEVKTPKGTILPLLSLKGKFYLEVKYRLVWFREEHPDWGIETEFTQESDNHAKCKATIKDEKGRIIAQAHKVETKAGFPDFDEKSETSAIGRALAHCGFGTQFAPELEEGERIVDSPVLSTRNRPVEKRVSSVQSAPVVSSPEPGHSSSSVEQQGRHPIPNHAPGAHASLSEKQVKRLYAICKKANWKEDELRRVLVDGYLMPGSDRIFDMASSLDKKSYEDLCKFAESGGSAKSLIAQLRGGPPILDSQEFPS